MSPQSTDYPTSSARGSPASTLRLWGASLGGSLMWLVHLIGVYLISEFGCAGGYGQQLWLGLSLVAWAGLALSGLTLSGAVLCAYLSRRHARPLDEANTESNLSGTDGAQFLTRSGLLSNRIFALIIAVETIPFLFYLQGC